jgi:glycosyltransferase involved in cell wall biosynthesis
MTSPVVSVVMATYNHAPYVAQAIESVLTQRDADIEFLIADDGSTDSTVQVVTSISDPRIRFFPHQANRGACVVTNELIGHASGEFVALINSDDYWSVPDKLSFQLDIMRKTPSLGATFGRVRLIDEQGAQIKKKLWSSGLVFDQPNRSQGAWLRHFFDFGNCLCHPTMLIRHRCYEELGTYNENLRQLPDFEMWIRLLKRYQIYVSDREMINFRLLPGNNVSWQTPDNSARIMSEHLLIAERFFDDFDSELLKGGFSDLLKHKEVPSAAHLDIEKALLFLVPNRTFGKAYQLIGILKLDRLLASERHREVLKADYGIDHLWFQMQTGKVDALRPGAAEYFSRYRRGMNGIIRNLRHLWR